MIMINNMIHRISFLLIFYEATLKELNQTGIQLNDFDSVGQINQNADFIVFYQPLGQFPSVQSVYVGETTFQHKHLRPHLR